VRVTKNRDAGRRRSPERPSRDRRVATASQ
jgi:hypothetical protein